jgi:hypothetical protein
MGMKKFIDVQLTAKPGIQKIFNKKMQGSIATNIYLNLPFAILRSIKEQTIDSFFMLRQFLF